jgi:hypothetical protein
MLTVIYEYTCDNCGDEVHASQRGAYRATDTLPLPERHFSVLQGDMLCSDCAGRARKGLEQESPQ